MRGRVIKEILREYGLVFYVKYVYCGKEKCRSCPHGPYLYVSRREGGKVKSVYLGRADAGLLAKRDKILAKVMELAIEYERESERLEEDFRKKLSVLVQSLLQEEHLD
uniref:DUF6788 domain-containing protein n=1 Tax=Thermocrinis ruber TaxID=75906 RepID=A0A7C5SZA0_9AQUI